MLHYVQLYCTASQLHIQYYMLVFRYCMLHSCTVLHCVLYVLYCTVLSVICTVLYCTECYLYCPVCYGTRVVQHAITNGQTVEAISEGLPQLDVVPSLALIIESIYPSTRRWRGQ